MALRTAEGTEAGKTLGRANPADLAETGWGVVFCQDADPAVREALSELLLHRQIRATWHKEGRYRELVYRPGETKHQFLARYGVGPGPADPDQLPYYLLLVGSPAEIPYHVQRQLGVQRAVGRICFDTALTYARYARSVVSAEGRDFDQPRRAVLFAPEHAGDPFTSWSARRLVAPLAEEGATMHSDWAVDAVLGPEATRDRLARLANGPESPALLFAAGHGLGFPPDDHRQLAHQGALLCQDWPGPGSGPVRADLYFSGEDVISGASLLGMIAVYLASYSAGTPLSDEYARRASREYGKTLARQPFIAALPQRLLGQPTGGLLAFVGLVDRLWGYTSDRGLAVYQEVLQRLMAGLPVGQALEPGRQAYAEASTELASALEEIQLGARPDDQQLFNAWTTSQDWGNMVILGDPAARLVARKAPEATVERPTIRPVVLEPEPAPEPEQPTVVHPFARLADAGWGVIFPYEGPDAEPRVPAIEEALQPLLDRRRAQAGEHFRTFAGPDGYRPGETALAFLTRHGIGAGAVTPEKVPFYLLIVGDPEAIPYEFQYQLDVRYAVGRIHFETVEEYAGYARSVVAAESSGTTLPPRVTFFAVQNPGDRATEYSLNYEIKPVARRLAEAQPGWTVETVLREEASKARLEQLLGGDDLPALLFTACHGLRFSHGDPRQAAEQGALLCQDWPGPQEWKGPIPPDFYFSGDDVPAEANLQGLLLFLSGPYTAGTPRLDDFAAVRAFQPGEIAPQAFVARLPQRLLAHPGGGALAVIGHVERNWAGNIVGPFPGAEAFFVLRRLLEGYPVGLAMEPYDLRYGQAATEWLTLDRRLAAGERVDFNEFHAVKTAAIDARNYVILGDPAVRLAVGDGPAATPRPRPRLPEFAFEAHDPAPFADLSAVGWGAVFPASQDGKSGPDQAAIQEALQPLLDLRRAQAGERFRLFAGADGYRPGETALKFLTRQGIAFGQIAPQRVPYYLLLVGDPEAIPYEFQYQLDVKYAVGRIHFDTVEEYAHYAQSVVAAETGGAALPRRATFFGVQNPGDKATEMSADYLVKPLARRLAEAQPAWEVETVLREEATKARLGQLLGGEGAPALLFTASHGMGFPLGDPRQTAEQGALLCQDWPGTGPISQDFYFAGDDVSPDAELLGRLAFFFTNYGAGTPRLDNFAVQQYEKPEPIAPQAFVARLPQRLLSHPWGGALAVIGHVERVWSYSFLEPRLTLPRVEAFVQMARRLLEGQPVGLAMEYLNARYGLAATDWLPFAMRQDAYEKVDRSEFAQAQTAAIDARNYVIVGDPAARLSVVSG
jgi:hypothetical protein